MNESDSAGACERCQAALFGHLGVFGGELCGVAVITIKATSPRNWICCDACAAMLCHACCSHPESGYCDACISKYGIKVALERPHESDRNQPPRAI